MNLVEQVAAAAYDRTLSDETWLARLVEAARPAFDRGLGVVGFFYELRSDGTTVVQRPVLVGTPDGAREALDRIATEAPPELVAALFRDLPSCATLSQRLEGVRITELPLYRETLAPLGIADVLCVAATSKAGAGCLVGAPLPRLTSVDARKSDVRTTIAAHIGAAIALRRAPNARSSWNAESWDIVDLQHASDATYLLAREHEEETPARHVSLSLRERAVAARAARGLSNKEIAYELGIAVSTVAGHLAKAASKLGAATRVDLIKAVVRSRLGA